MVFLNRCPRCKSRDVRLEDNTQGLYWHCPKCQHVQIAIPSPATATAQCPQAR